MKKRAVVILFFLFLLGPLVVSQLGQSQQNYVYAINVEGTIDAGISNFVVNAINRAERENAALIIKMNTPGGLLSATEEIVGRMMRSDARIVVWITPAGAWGFSAGTYILMASRVAVMDQGTAIGAAQPRPEDPKATAAMAEWLGSIAENRGRPSEKAELFVTQSLTMNPAEALDNRIIELRATSIDQILDNIGKTGASIKNIEMGLFEEVLRALSNPEVATILFTLGFLGLLAEVMTPGIGVPGVAGAICLLLALWGLGMLQINFVGVALFLLGIALIAAEIFTPGFGVFGVGGALALILGLMMVGIHREPWIEVSSDIIRALAMALIVVFAVLILLVRRTVRKPPVVGKEQLIGQIGLAVTGIAPRGLVKIRGELWTATSEEHIKKGEQVVVKDMKGIVLVVRKRGEPEKK
ncbi:MAG: nodulation protein NfeD [Methanobacteriota archaeon]